MTGRQLLAAYREAAGHQHTWPEREAIVARFLTSGRPWSAAGIRDFLESRDVKPSTAEKEMRILRSFAQATGLPWPNVRWRWDQEQAPSQRIAVDDAVVRAMVGAMPRVPRRARAWLVLAILYGCRAAELGCWSCLTDLGPEAIFIHRVKKGDSRWYWLPPQARPYLEGVLLHPVHRRETYPAWQQLCRVGGVTRVPGVAWHSIRRATAAGMVKNGLSLGEVQAFMSWAGRERQDMAKLYANPTAVAGPDGKLRAPSRAGPPKQDMRNLEPRAWDTHPYLGLL